ncbi:hypothetical protein CcCBS67573_g03929 [Chytriomyces confervae]|uniref:Uncharacterized protein n=1 Tax=Chytriomyces confervae TaxID=246404 RepID=A0A507FEP1_9FUNG|nr:hypothetical protein CcCBS67573_g03929 [Chytriomyces confervae]
MQQSLPLSVTSRGARSFTHRGASIRVLTV